MWLGRNRAERETVVDETRVFKADAATGVAAHEMKEVRERPGNASAHRSARRSDGRHSRVLAPPAPDADGHCSRPRAGLCAWGCSRSAASCPVLVNLREAVARYVQRVRSALRQVLTDDAPGVPEPLPVLLTDRPAQPRYGRSPHLHRLQEARRAEREQRYQEVKRLHALGLSYRQVARRCGLSARTVREWAHTETLAPDRRGYHAVTSKIDPFVPYLQQRLAEGCTNQSRLWREICTQGFTGTRELVAKWIHAQYGDQAALHRTLSSVLPSTQQLTWLILGQDEGLADDKAAVWQRLQQHEGVAQIRELARQFAALVRERQLDHLDPWLDACRTRSIEEMATFAVALTKDDDAVRAALTLPWSTGPVEGHIHKVKLIKRSAYGRMKPDLLRQRVLHAA